jgi:hypothetical protein
MPAKADLDRILAQTLAAPFTPRSQGIPLSLRRLPDGGMVVITADGRKLWFSAVEVCVAHAELNKRAKAQSVLPENLKVKLDHSGNS